MCFEDIRPQTGVSHDRFQPQGIKLVSPDALVYMTVPTSARKFLSSQVMSALYQIPGFEPYTSFGSFSKLAQYT